MRWVAKLVARLLAILQLSGLKSVDIFQKYEMGDISKGVANTLYCPPKNIKKYELSLQFTPLDGWPV
jgi:hypothetical protein